MRKRVTKLLKLFERMHLQSELKSKQRSISSGLKCNELRKRNTLPWSPRHHHLTRTTSKVGDTITPITVISNRRHHTLRAQRLVTLRHHMVHSGIVKLANGHPLRRHRLLPAEEGPLGTTTVPYMTSKSRAPTTLHKNHPSQPLNRRLILSARSLRQSLLGRNQVLASVHIQSIQLTTLTTAIRLLYTTSLFLTCTIRNRSQNIAQVMACPIIIAELYTFKMMDITRTAVDIMTTTATTPHTLIRNLLVTVITASE